MPKFWKTESLKCKSTQSSPHITNDMDDVTQCVIGLSAKENNSRRTLDTICQNNGYKGTNIYWLIKIYEVNIDISFWKEMRYIITKKAVDDLRLYSSPYKIKILPSFTDWTWWGKIVRTCKNRLNFQFHLFDGWLFVLFHFFN